MQKFIAAGVLMLGFSTAQAQSENAIEFCSLISKMAFSVMNARQNNVPMDELYKLSTGDIYIDALGRKMIKEAFQQAQMPNNYYRMQAATDFRNKEFQTCILIMQNK